MSRSFYFFLFFASEQESVENCILLRSTVTTYAVRYRSTSLLSGSLCVVRYVLLVLPGRRVRLRRSLSGGCPCCWCENVVYSSTRLRVVVHGTLRNWACRPDTCPLLLVLSALSHPAIHDSKLFRTVRNFWRVFALLRTTGE